MAMASRSRGAPSQVLRVPVIGNKPICRASIRIATTQAARIRFGEIGFMARV